MSRPDRPAQRLPIVEFVDALRRTRDALAIAIVSTILLLSVFSLLLPVSSTVRVAGARRFQLAGWPFAAWALFQALPSMYNFENTWDVTFTSRAATPADEACRRKFGGFTNHHVLDAVLLQRVALERCGLPALVRFKTTYRGTTVVTRYLLTAGPGLHGFVITPQPER